MSKPMTTWTSDELDKIGTAEELEITSLRRYGTLRNPVTIWVVRLGDDLYVRSVNGRTSAWFRGVQERHEGRIQAGGVEKDVSFVEESDPGLNDRIDAVCRTVSADHDVNAYLHLLNIGGDLTIVGAPAKPLPVTAFALIFGNRSLSGSNVGGIAETQEMLDFCGEHNITADVEVIPIQKVNEAYERLLKSDVKYRFSIDMASLKSE
jgi:hypothetical protein